MFSAALSSSPVHSYIFLHFKNGRRRLPTSGQKSASFPLISLSMASPILSGKWTGKSLPTLFSAACTVIVFLVLDFLDAILCVIYRFLDDWLEGSVSVCYCDCRVAQSKNAVCSGEDKISDTLYCRENRFRKMGILGFCKKRKLSEKTAGEMAVSRWSDCGCESCVSWTKNIDGQKLHVVVREPSLAPTTDVREKSADNVIFIHGFLCSSYFWTETVFENLTEGSYRLLALDLLGFGKSPKPRNCLYTVKDHLEMIEKSLILPFQLNDFHLVAHSMGCVLALALAAKYSKSVKTITLVAPPYFGSEEGGSLLVLKTLAMKRLWPPLLFFSSVMSWYEHLGRTICFIICRNHRVWERILKLFFRTRYVDLMTRDMTKHTHHSAWHTMHNVICEGAQSIDDYLRVLKSAGVKIKIFHGEKDLTVPAECAYNMKKKAPFLEIETVSNADHNSIIFGREKEFTSNLEHLWTSSSR